MELQQHIDALCQIALSPGVSVKQAMAKSGKKAVGCFPIYTPEELVYAAGMLPVGMWGGQRRGNLSNQYLQTFCCSVMRANTEQALSGDYDGLSAIIMTAYCDTLKCVIENWKAALPNQKLIPMVYAQNRKTKAGREYMSAEFTRVKKELEKVAERKISDAQLSAAIDIYDDYRSTMQKLVAAMPRHQSVFSARVRHLVIKAAYFMDKKEYTDRIKEILSLLPQGDEPKGFKVILTGLIAEPLVFLDILDESGYVVVADDLAQESRQFREIADAKLPPIERLVQRVAQQDGCAFLYDEDKTRAARLIAMAQAHQADAVLYCQLKFCDPDEFDYPIVKKALADAALPLLYIEVEQQMDSMEQLRTRVQSFAEILPCGGD